MKKKQIAVLLAALLSVSPAAEGVAVMGADFSAGEGTSEAVEVQMEKEESTEDAVPFFISTDFITSPFLPKDVTV